MQISLSCPCLTSLSLSPPPQSGFTLISYAVAPDGARSAALLACSPSSFRFRRVLKHSGCLHSRAWTLNVHTNTYTRIHLPEHTNVSDVPLPPCLVLPLPPSPRIMHLMHRGAALVDQQIEMLMIANWQGKGARFDKWLAENNYRPAARKYSHPQIIDSGSMQLYTIDTCLKIFSERLILNSTNSRLISKWWKKLQIKRINK